MSAARILVVEDDRIVARDIEHQLTAAGYTVVGRTARGEEAIEFAVTMRPDLVLMDRRLDGEMDGIDAAMLIRERCRIPVIFLTAYADEETVRRASLAEPFGYLLKPFEESQLRTAVEIALYKHAAERRLRESERRFATTLASIGDAVIATDASAKITFMNSVAESLTGWERAEALGRPLTEVFRIVNERTREVAHDPVERVLRLGKVVGLANHSALISRDGHARPIDDSGAPIIDDDGNVSGAVLVFRDVTHRRQIDEALRKAQAELTRASHLTTMGELTASIAHDVSPPLAAMIPHRSAGPERL